MANERQRGHDISDTGRQVAANIARARKSQQVSLKELEDRLAARGRRISVSSLSKIENEDRKVDVDDLMAIALCLDTSPLALMLPTDGDPDTPARVTGGYGSLALIWGWGLGTDPSEPQASERAFRARCLPDFIETENAGIDVVLQARKEVTELGWAPAGSDEIETRWTIRTNPRYVRNGERQA